MDGIPPEQRRRGSSGVYNAPNSYTELGEILAQQPIDEDAVSDTETPALDPVQRRDSGVYSVPRSYSNLDEVSPVPPIEEPPFDDGQDVQGRQRRRSSFARHEGPILEPEPIPEEAKERRVSRLATELYTHSYLIFFAILGTLARLGLTALTRYPGTPVIFNTIWANFTGSAVMGFLAEDRKLFRNEWGNATYDEAIKQAKQKRKDEEDGSSSSQQKDVDLKAAKKAHLAMKKTIPLYIGLATGFCGSFYYVFELYQGYVSCLVE
ncbi:hypothetical protein CEP52_011777 [Fusarium oligoseptatum]|uniref:Uncharacterized protein n=1 Tax=Fusarium oligoseptatum TaxID=2604345 RepID=A0A428T1M7_9HYPO|nr:hypothetical protein CEP52_011777 [Fusarium oligoseptatum]